MGNIHKKIEKNMRFQCNAKMELNMTPKPIKILHHGHHKEKNVLSRIHLNGRLYHKQYDIEIHHESDRVTSKWDLP